MKKLVQVQEVDVAGLAALLGKQVLIMCGCYFYAGKLTGVDTDDIILEDAGIVYETGPLSEPGFKDFQKFGVKEWGVKVHAIESYGEMG